MIQGKLYTCLERNIIINGLVIIDYRERIDNAASQMKMPFLSKGTLRFLNSTKSSILIVQLLFDNGKNENLRSNFILYGNILVWL